MENSDTAVPWSFQSVVGSATQSSRVAQRWLRDAWASRMWQSDAQHHGRLEASEGPREETKATGQLQDSIAGARHPSSSDASSSLDTWRHLMYERTQLQEAQNQASEREFVVVEKRAVEVNAFADEQRLGRDRPRTEELRAELQSLISAQDELLKEITLGLTNIRSLQSRADELSHQLDNILSQYTIVNDHPASRHLMYQRKALQAMREIVQALQELKAKQPKRFKSVFKQPHTTESEQAQELNNGQTGMLVNTNNQVPGGHRDKVAEDVADLWQNIRARGRQATSHSDDEPLLFTMSEVPPTQHPKSELRN